MFGLSSGVYELGLSIYFILRSEIIYRRCLPITYMDPGGIDCYGGKNFSSSTSGGIRPDAGGFVALIRNDELNAHVISRMPDP